MNRIDQLFKEKKEGILSVYLTAGFPELNDTIEIISSLQNGGVDMVEIGMPFSDPLADGPVIQESSQKALKNGMSIRLLFAQLKDIRKQVDLPIILMGYLNPVLQFGFEDFIDNCVEVGIDGLIIPDLPLTIYEKGFRKKVESAGLDFVMLITPQTSEDRVREIAAASGGFLYMVADSATTGARKQLEGSQIEYFERINAMDLAIPRLIGFGISNRETFIMASEYASGVIIGSAFINALGQRNSESLNEKVSEFVKSLL